MYVFTEYRTRDNKDSRVYIIGCFHKITKFIFKMKMKFFYFLLEIVHDFYIIYYK